MRYIGNVEKDAQVRAVASGALSNGDTVIVNSDGTVSAVVETAVTAAFGSVTTASSSEISISSCAYDSAAGKVVISYKDNGNNQYPTSIVGTVSGTSISFGTPVVMESAAGRVGRQGSTYDTASGKIVVCYQQYSSSITRAVVGTVSGTSISFGSPSTIISSSNPVSVAYDANAQKVVFAYQDRNNLYRGVARVGSVSGTSISFGSEVVYNSSESNGGVISYDSNAQKVVICYRDNGNSQYGTAIAGTVSGTSISFGSPTVFRSATTDYLASTYHSGQNKTIVCYQDRGNSDRGTASALSVSGSSVVNNGSDVFETSLADTYFPVYNSASDELIIFYTDTTSSSAGTYVTGYLASFSTPAVFDSTNIEDDSLSGVYDAGNNRIVAAYVDTISSPANQLKSIVYRSSGTLTNITSDNFIGFADGAYADTQSAVINTTCSVDRSQTSLTAGQKYYVQADGSLSETAGDPSVEAGTAISSTEILVKG